MVAVGLILYGKVIEKHRPSVRILDESHLTVGVRHHDYIGAAHLGPLHKHPEGIHITFRIKGPHIDFGTVPVAVFPDSHQEAAQKLLIKPGRTPRMFIFGHKRKHHCHTHLMERGISGRCGVGGGILRHICGNSLRRSIVCGIISHSGKRHIYLIPFGI